MANAARMFLDSNAYVLAKRVAITTGTVAAQVGSLDYNPETGVLRGGFKVKCVSVSKTTKPNGQADHLPSRASSMTSDTVASAEAGQIMRSFTDSSTSSSGEASDDTVPAKMRSRKSWQNSRGRIHARFPEAVDFGALQQRPRPISAGPIAEAAMSLMTAQRMRRTSVQHTSTARPGGVLRKSGGIAT